MVLTIISLGRPSQVGRSRRRTFSPVSLESGLALLFLLCSKREYFEDVRDFYQRTAGNGRAVIFTADQ